MKFVANFSKNRFFAILSIRCCSPIASIFSSNSWQESRRSSFDVVTVSLHHFTQPHRRSGRRRADLPSPALVFTEISQETAVNPVDIVSTLQSLQMLKYWKGKHLVLKRQVGNKTFDINSDRLVGHASRAQLVADCLSSELDYGAFSSLQDLIDDWKAKETKRGNGKTIDPKALKWTPPKGT